MLLLSLGGAVSGRAATLLYGPDQNSTAIFVGASAAPDERAAADDLARVLGRMSGLVWRVRFEEGTETRGIFVGATRRAAGEAPLVLAADPLAPGTGQVGPDAFRVVARDGNVVIVGATPEACPFAVAWFLQHEAGVRWYAPGPDGEVVPPRGELAVPDLNLLVQPAYFSRELTGFDDPAGRAWARHNGLRARLEYSHAMGRAFPPGLYAAHPDWFPLLGGQRYQPASPSDPNWQPNLALPAVADHAAEVAVAALSGQPDQLSFSLGINDSMRFDQGEETRSLVEPVRYYRGMPDYSPLVFRFMDRVAKAVGRREPGRYLGCLAYFWCQVPPPFPVEGHVIPYVAADRTQYYDAGFRAGDLALLARWGASGVRAFGLWDYAYGDGFVVPRQAVDLLADGLREGWKRGARGYIAELGAGEGLEAFKAWALARLLWDPSLTVGALEDDFFPGFYGAAAGPLRQVFEVCQERWRSQGGAPFWLKYFRQSDQALLFPPETCARLRRMIASAEEAATPDPVVAARVAAVSRAFARTEAFVEYDADRRALAAFGEANLADPGAEEGLASAIGRLARDRARTAGVSDSLLRDDPAERLLVLAAQSDRKASRRLLHEAGPAAERWPSWSALAAGLAGSLEEAPNLATNSSFADIGSPAPWPHFLYPQFGDVPDRWILRAMPTEGGRVALVDAAGRGSGRAIRIEAAWDTQLYQWVAAQAAFTYLATARLRGFSSPGADAGLILTFLSSAGGVLASTAQTLPKGNTRSWRVAALGGLAPPGAAWVGLGVSAERQQSGDWLEAEGIEVRGTQVNAEP